jgi:hypothetical protein
MKKLSLLGAVLAIMLLPLAFGDSSYAASTCPVGFTGPNSHNVCESTTNYTCTVKNDNSVTVDTTNQQIALTGSAAGGSAQTGSATNTNGTTFTATVTAGTACTVVATTAPITPVVTPPATQTAAPQAATPKPTVLANTATLSPAMVVASLMGILGGSVIVARLAVTAYGHFKA